MTTDKILHWHRIDGRAGYPPEGLAVWASRSASGFYVQGLVDSDGRTYITTALAGKTETVEVDPSIAADAFLHPFAYDASSLPL
jgi:hypothetical protein